MIDDISLERLSKHLQQASDDGFTGSININFYKGGITEIKKQSSERLLLTEADRVN